MVIIWLNSLLFLSNWNKAKDVFPYAAFTELAMLLTLVSAVANKDGQQRPFFWELTVIVAQLLGFVQNIGGGADVFFIFGGSTSLLYAFNGINCEDQADKTDEGAWCAGPWLGVLTAVCQVILILQAVCLLVYISVSAGWSKGPRALPLSSAADSSTMRLRSEEGSSHRKAHDP